MGMRKTIKVMEKDRELFKFLKIDYVCEGM